MLEPGSPCARRFQEVLADGDLPSIRWWLGWAGRSWLEPFRKLSRRSKGRSKGVSPISYIF